MAVGEEGNPSLEDWVEGGRYKFLILFLSPAPKSSVRVRGLVVGGL